MPIMARQHLAAIFRHIDLDSQFENRQQFTLPDALPQTTVYAKAHSKFVSVQRCRI